MTASDRPVDITKLIRHARPKSASGSTVESELDSLLSQHATANAFPGASAESSQSESASPMEALRCKFRDEYQLAIDELAGKYAANGVHLELNVQGFLDGGRELSIVIEFANSGVRLSGVVTSDTIAFSETRYVVGSSGGIASSGPSLRTRTLTADSFRDFVCGQITALVQMVMKKKQAALRSGRKKP